MEKDILVSDVSISTLAVEVKVMKIGTRQVTLAVFKQLPDKQIIDFSTGKLLGTPWGRVNYHPDCEKNAPVHFHIVWDDGKALCRATIERSWMYSPPAEDLLYGEGNPLLSLQNDAEAFLCGRLLEGWVPETKFTRKFASTYAPFQFSPDGEHTVRYSIEHGSWLNEKPRLVKAVEAKWRYTELAGSAQRMKEEGRYLGYIQENLTDAHQRALEAKESLLSLLESRNYPRDSGSIYQMHLLPSILEHQAFEATWKQSYGKLEQLDQLFIAV